MGVTERLDRLAADRDLHLQLGLTGYQGALWNRFQRVLAEYGQPVFSSWLRRGAVHEKCRMKGIRIVAAEVQPQGDEVDDLAVDVVVAAIPAFRDKVLIPSRWDPTRGATLKTFFVGQCLLQYPNIYKAWLADKKALQHLRTTALTDLLSDTASTSLPSLEVGAELSRRLAEMKASNDQRPHIIVAEEMGYSQREIAETFSKTERAVEAVLYRWYHAK